MPYKQKETIKLYYSIGEVAELLNVNASLIRFWEKEFDSIKPKKNKKGNRLFIQKDIEHLKVIYHLVKERGYTLQGAKEKIKNNPDEVGANAIVVQKLNKIRKFLLDIKNEL